MSIFTKKHFPEKWDEYYQRTAYTDAYMPENAWRAGVNAADEYWGLVLEKIRRELTAGRLDMAYRILDVYIEEARG